MKQSEIGQALDNLQNEYSFESQIISILNGNNLKYRGYIGLAKFTKDIAIGFNQWQVSMKCDYWWSVKRNMWIKYGLDNISITTEQLFNEYLNTLK